MSTAADPGPASATTTEAKQAFQAQVRSWAQTPLPPAIGPGEATPLPWRP
jgi:hypothetical protein